MDTVAERRALVSSTLIDHVMRVDLAVQSLDVSLVFYRDIVGLEVVVLSDESADLASPGGPVILRLNATATSPADPRATGLFHTAFRFPTRSSLGDALTRLATAGIHIAAGDHLVSEALYIDDPDGNGVELYWDRPTEEWPPPSNGMIVPMATLPVDLQALLNRSSGRAAIGASAPPGTDIGHVHLQVSEIERTVTFYAGVLGLDLMAKLGSSAAFLSSNGYHHHLGANSWQSRGSGPRALGRAGLERVVFAVSRAAQLETISSRAGGSQKSDGTLVLEDPDGIELRFSPVS